MKKILYLFLLLLPVLGVAQSRYGVEGVPMCWTTALGVDSSIIRYVLVSTTGQPVKTIVHENVSGVVVNVSGGTLRYGFCDCAGGLDSLANGSVSWAKLASAVKDSINKSVTWSRLAEPVKDSIRIGMNPKRDIKETVIEAIGSPSNRSDMPSCIRLNGDTLLLMYEQFPGGSGDFDNYYLVKRYSYDNGVTWQARQNVFATTPLPEIDRGFGIPSLLQSNDTTHLIFWGGRNYPGDPGGNYYDAKIYYTRSTDKGVTWSTPVNIQGVDTTYHAPGSDRLIKLKSGRLFYVTGVMQNSTPSSETGNYTVFKAYSDDNGTTWSYSTTGLTSPSLLAVEPGVYQLEDGTIVCYMRTRDNWIYAANSSDNGATWTSPYKYPLDAGNTMSAIKYVPELQSVVAVYNPKERNASGTLISTQQGDRRTLAIAVSRGGLSFSDPIVIFRGNTRSSYVSIEPSIFYDTTTQRLSIFHSPCYDSGLLNYELRQTWLSDIPYIGSSSQEMKVSTTTTNLIVEPRSTADGLVFSGSGNGASGGYARWKLGAGTANTFHPLFETLPIGDYPTEWRVYQTATSTSTTPLVIDFRKATGGAVTSSLLELRNNVASKFKVEADGSMKIGSVGYYFGSGSPEGVVSATMGSLYVNTLGGNSNTLWIKQGGSLATGWAAAYVSGTTFAGLTVAPTNTSTYLTVSGSGTGASGGYTRFGLGTAAANTYWPYMQSLPFGNYSTQWEFRQTTSSTSTPPLIFDFLKGAGGALDANTVMQRWTSNGLTRMTVDQEGDLVANSFTGRLILPVGTAAANTGPLKFTLSGHTQKTTPEAGLLEPSTDGTRLLYTPISGQALDVFVGYRGSGSPEGVVTAPIGSIYINTLGGASTTMYIKESGSGNTGWIAK